MEQEKLGEPKFSTQPSPTVTISEQSAILLEAIEDELLRPGDIVRWADNVIVTMDESPWWIIELATLDSPYLVNLASRLREHASPLPGLRWRIQIVVLAHRAGLLTWSAALQKLFPVLMLKLLPVAVFEPNRDQRDARDEALAECLALWDCQEDLEVIEPALLVKLTRLFQEYSADAGGIAAILPWKFERTDATSQERADSSR